MNKREFATSRNLRTSPIQLRILDHKAAFGQFLGYERPLFFRYFGPNALTPGKTILIGLINDHQLELRRLGLLF